MSHPNYEPYEISARFYLALEAKARSLELDAQQDAQQAASLSDPEHVKRHHRLVEAQRAEANRYFRFLADVRIRIEHR